MRNKGEEYLINDWEVTKKDAEGNRFEIRISFNDYKKKLFVRDVGMIKKGKRKVWWIGRSLSDDYSWRRLDSTERRKAQEQKLMEYVPEELILEAIEEVWKSLRPNNENFFN